MAIPATQQKSQAFFFPISYDPAQRVAPNAAIPMLPKAFNRAEVGWKVVTRVVEQRGEIIGISGEATYTILTMERQGAFGENAGPIYGEGSLADKKLVDNWSPMPSITATTTHFYLFARPGKSYTIPLKQGTKTVNAVVTCTVGDAAAKTVAQR